MNISNSTLFEITFASFLCTNYDFCFVYFFPLLCLFNILLNEVKMEGKQELFSLFSQEKAWTSNRIRILNRINHGKQNFSDYAQFVCIDKRVGVKLKLVATLPSWLDFSVEVRKAANNKEFRFYEICFKVKQSDEMQAALFPVSNLWLCELHIVEPRATQQHFYKFTRLV